MIVSTNSFGEEENHIIVGSAGHDTSNHRLAACIAAILQSEYFIVFAPPLYTLPHFNPDYSVANVPESVVAFREQILTAHGVVGCTPEYIFSLRRY